METAAQARDRWRTFGEAIRFTPDDFDVVDLALDVVPDLRICAAVLKYARARKVRYPVSSLDELVKYLDKGRLMAGEHAIDVEEIKAYMHPGFFPIEHEGVLLSRVYAALGRHRQEAALLSSLPRARIEKFLTATRIGG